MSYAGSVGLVWHRAVPVIILVAGALLSFALFQAVTLAEQQRVRNVIELYAEWRSGDIKHRLVSAVDAVEATAAFMASVRDLPGADKAFQRFVVQARADGPVARITWAPWIRNGERAAFERDGPPVKHCSTDGHQGPAPERQEYAPIRLDALFEDRPPLLGCDLLLDPTRATMAERARDSGHGVLTAPVVPLSGPRPVQGVVVVWPVYASSVPTTMAERRAALTGFVTGALSSDSLLSYAVGGATDMVETLHIFAGDVRDAATGVPMATWRPDIRLFQIGQHPIGEAPANGVRLLRTFEVGGQVWTVVFDLPTAAMSALGTSWAWFYLALCLLVTGLLSAYVVMEQRRRLAVEATVAQRTRDLQATNEQLRAIINASPMAIFSLDPERRVTMWNDAAERIFGHAQADVLGKPVPALAPDDDGDFEARLKQVAEGKALKRLDTTRLRKDGSSFEASISAAPIVTPDGRFLGAVALVEDVTERNLIQRQLVHAQKMETVGQLTGGLAHDFNNILGVVVGNLDLLEPRLATDPPAARFCRQALDAALSAAELVKRLLAFSRRQQLWPVPTPVDRVITNLSPLLARTLGENIRIETAVDDNLWLAMADAGQLESALLNLAVNARDAMPDGGLLVISASNMMVDDSTAPVADALTPGAYVAISVSDSGTGMTPEVLSHALEPFYTTKAPGSGSGLGLSMVFGTMRQLGGTVKIYSELGLGTTVRLYLPRAKSDADRSVAPDVTPTALPTGNEHILLVEDNAQVRTLGVGILRDLGYRITTAQNGDEALALVEAGGSFDLLFSDIVMPGALNGIALAQRVRARRPDMPILLASGFSNPEAVVGATGAIGATLIAKPYRKAQLAAMIRDMLDGRKEVVE